MKDKKSERIRHYLNTRDFSTNRDIRQLITDRRLTLAQVAHSIGTTRDKFTQRLRHELPEKDKRLIKEAIENMPDFNGEKE